jgi:hypothetical protein
VVGTVATHAPNGSRGKAAGYGYGYGYGYGLFSLGLSIVPVALFTRKEP